MCPPNATAINAMTATMSMSSRSMGGHSERDIGRRVRLGVDRNDLAALGLTVGSRLGLFFGRLDFRSGHRPCLVKMPKTKIIYAISLRFFDGTPLLFGPLPERKNIHSGLKVFETGLLEDPDAV